MVCPLPRSEILGLRGITGENFRNPPTWPCPARFSFRSNNLVEYQISNTLLENHHSVTVRAFALRELLGGFPTTVIRRADRGTI